MLFWFCLFTVFYNSRVINLNAILNNLINYSIQIQIGPLDQTELTFLPHDEMTKEILIRDFLAEDIVFMI